MCFSEIRLLFEVIFCALVGDFSDVGAAYFREGVRNCFGTLFGSILGVFWTVFGNIFGIMSEVLFMKNVVLPAWELKFQKILCFPRFFFVGRHFINSCFTCMGAQFSRIYLKFRLPFFKYQNCKKM